MKQFCFYMQSWILCVSYMNSDFFFCLYYLGILFFLILVHIYLKALAKHCKAYAVTSRTKFPFEKANVEISIYIIHFIIQVQHCTQSIIRFYLTCYCVWFWVYSVCFLQLEIVAKWHIHYYSKSSFNSLYVP